MIKSFSQFNINESNSIDGEIHDLKNYLSKFSWTKMSISSEAKLSIDSLLGEDTFEKVRNKSQDIIKSFEIVDDGYIEDRLTDLLDDKNEYMSSRVLFGVVSKNYKLHLSEDPRGEKNFPNIFSQGCYYTRSYTHQDEFIDILIAKIVIDILDYHPVKRRYNPYNFDVISEFKIENIDKCLNYFLPSVGIQILNPESEKFSSKQAKLDIESILPSILPTLDYCGIVWPLSNNWSWGYKVKILLN
jgi:hypothetical protein